MKGLLIMSNIKLTIFSIIFLSFSGNVFSTPEKSDCDWVPRGEIIRIRDLDDCQKFYYCAKGVPPYRASCPYRDQSQFYSLYFNPNTTNCDWREFAHPSCFGTGNGTGTGVYVTTTSTTTTTTLPPPTTKPPRPPLLNDQPDFEIDCTKRVCGLFPNTYGACDTFAVCVDGQKIIKKCNGGQLFDVKTRECQPSNLAKCWTEPNAGPHNIRKKQQDCPFHGKPPATPFVDAEDKQILQNPVVTNWGEWQNWENCPAGKYATGIYAWRRLLMSGANYSKKDHAGIVAVSFTCQSPGGNETANIIESLAPHLPKDGWPFYYMCKGAVVGFRLNSARGPLPGTNDYVTTDNVQAMCSCSAPAYKPYEQAIYAPQNGHRGDWTAEQNCRKFQAVCGMQTQMQEYKENVIGTYDNTGMNNFRVKCCNVPSPMKSCFPREQRILIRTCDNSKSDEDLKCDFEGEVGLSMDIESQQKAIDFYSSVGYTFNDSKAEVAAKIEKVLKKRIEDGVTLEYTWDDIIPSTFGDQVVTQRTMFVKPFKKLDLYQIVGSCNYILARTNRYVKVITDSKTKRKDQVYFEV